MFWLWAAVIAEGVLILILFDWVRRISIEAHQRVSQLEESVTSLEADMKHKADKYL